MIHSHLYIKSPTAPVFLFPGETELPLGVLAQGSWVGVLETAGDWVKILGVQGMGWVNRVHLESRPPLDLHIHQVNVADIEYVSTST